MVDGGEGAQEVGVSSAATAVGDGTRIDNGDNLPGRPDDRGSAKNEALGKVSNAHKTKSRNLGPTLRLHISGRGQV